MLMSKGRPSGSDYADRIAAIVAQLPDINYAIAKALLQFLSRVAEKEPINKMGAANLATVFGPNLMRRPDGEINASAVQDYAIINVITQTLIEQAGHILEVCARCEKVHTCDARLCVRAPFVSLCCMRTD
jgi:hypothetical protein